MEVNGRKHGKLAGKIITRDKYWNDAKNLLRRRVRRFDR
jgi:hypothetical protein